MIQPLAMMIKLLDALVANRTMLGFVIDDVDIAQVTIAILDDVTELTPIKLGNSYVSTDME